MTTGSIRQALADSVTYERPCPSYVSCHHCAWASYLWRRSSFLLSNWTLQIPHMGFSRYV